MKMNDPAVCKSFLFQECTHAGVFFMCVNPDAASSKVFCICHKLMGKVFSLAFPCNGNPVDHHIRIIIQPCPIDHIIRIFMIHADACHTQHRTIFLQYKRTAPFHIMMKVIPGRIAVDPLRNIMCMKECLCILHDLHDCIQILFSCLPDHSVSLFQAPSYSTVP